MKIWIAAGKNSGGDGMVLGYWKEEPTPDEVMKKYYAWSGIPDEYQVYDGTLYPPGHDVDIDIWCLNPYRDE